MSRPRHSALYLVCALAVLIAAVCPARAQTQLPFDHAALARTALEKHIRPGYARLAEAATAAVRSIARDCLATDEGGRKPIESAFDRLVSAWGRIEHIRFGPITTDNRLERILFWPDRRGIGARQLARALAKRDESVLDAAALASKSVALQGLTALEFVLFPGEGWPAVDAAERNYRCRFAAAIGVNVAKMSRAVLDDWTGPDGYSRHWLKPGSGNPHFVLSSETTLALAKGFGEGLERVRDDRIGGPLGLNADRRKTPALLAASDRTLLLVFANLEGLRELLTKGGIRDAILETRFKAPNINVAANLKLIVSELEKARGLARQLARIKKPFESKQALTRLTAMGFPLKNARIQTGALLTLTANLAFGFNSSDGD